ncbi:MAG: hypothetical protein IPK66_17845 [Rhodospirillales bacterium]|nr:hypothetical protein [Rhodospirillales bacterium]
MPRRTSSRRGGTNYLRHALGELGELAPQAGEEEELARRRALLMNAEKLIQAIADAIAALE